jgi:hypothetical protein
MKSIFRLGFISAAVFAFSGTTSFADSARATTSPSSQTPTTAPAARLLRTEDFESGATQMSQASTTQLEDFLRDLNRRKDFDFASHGGVAGPNADYLANWVTQVTNELIARGYWNGTDGEFHRPDGYIVPVR